MLQWCLAGGPHGAGNVLCGVASGAEAFQKRIQEIISGSFAYVDDVSLGLKEATANTVRDITFLWRELDDISIVVDPSKTAEHERARRGRFRS